MYEEHIAKDIRINNKHLFKYIENRKLLREAAVPLDDQGIKRLLKEDGVIREKLNEFIASLFVVDVCGCCTGQNNNFQEWSLKN